MVSFKEVQELLPLRHGANFIDDEEFLFLYVLFDPRNLDFPYKGHSRFDLDDTSETECLAEFRFRKRDTPELAKVLQIPQTITCS